MRARGNERAELAVLSQPALVRSCCTPHITGAVQCAALAGDGCPAELIVLPPHALVRRVQHRRRRVDEVAHRGLVPAVASSVVSDPTAGTGQEYSGIQHSATACKMGPPGTAGARDTGRNADVDSVAGCTPREARYAWCAGRMQSRPSHLVRRVRCADGCGCARTRGRPARVSAPTPPRASSSRRPASTRPFSRRVEYSQHGTASHSCFHPPGLGHQSAASTRNLLP